MQQQQSPFTQPPLISNSLPPGSVGFGAHGINTSSNTVNLSQQNPAYKKAAQKYDQSIMLQAQPQRIQPREAGKNNSPSPSNANNCDGGDQSNKNKQSKGFSNTQFVPQSKATTMPLQDLSFTTRKEAVHHQHTLGYSYGGGGSSNTTTNQTGIGGGLSSTSQSNQITSRGMTGSGNPHSILSTNGLLSLANKIDAAKISNHQMTGGGGVMPLSHIGMKQDGKPSPPQAMNKPPKQQQHPIFRKPGVFIASINDASGIDVNKSGQGLNTGAQSTNLQNGNIAVAQSNGQFFYGTKNAHRTTNDANNSQYIFTNSQTNFKSVFSNLDNLESSQHSQQTKFNNHQRQQQQQFMIQPNFTVPSTLLPNTVVMMDDDPSSSVVGNNQFEMEQLRQNIFLSNKIGTGGGGGGAGVSNGRQQQQFSNNGMMAKSGGKNPAGITVIGSKNNEMIFNYILPSQQYAPLSYQQQKNKSMKPYAGTRHGAGGSESPMKGTNAFGGPGGSQSKQNGFSPHVGGHLFSYNEIRDRKKNLASSLKNKTTKAFDSSQQPNYIVPDVNFMNTVQFQNQNNSPDGPNSGNGMWVDPNNFVQSALVIQNFVFYMQESAGTDQKQGQPSKSNTRQSSFGDGPQFSPNQQLTAQQQMQIIQLQRQFQQQFGFTPQQAQQLLPTMMMRQQQQQFQMQQPPAHPQQSDFIDLNLDPSLKQQQQRNNVFIGQGKRKQHFVADDVNMFIPQERGDTALRMLLANEYRERIKQIYAQTGKILEETLTQNPLTQQHMLQRNVQVNNNEDFDQLANGGSASMYNDPQYFHDIFNSAQAVSSSFDRQRRRASDTNNNLYQSNDIVTNDTFLNKGAWPNNMGESPHYSREINGGVNRRGMQSLAPKRSRLDKAGDDTSEERMDPDFNSRQYMSSGGNGRNPSVLRKQYCNSQKQADRQMKRNSSSSEYQNIVSQTNRLDNQQRPSDKDPSDQVASSSSQIPNLQKQNGYRRIQQPKVTTTSQQKQLPQRNFMASSKSKNELSSLSMPLNASQQQQKLFQQNAVKEVIEEKDKEYDNLEQEKTPPTQEGNQINNQPVNNNNQNFIRPVRRLVNPYDEFLKGQERILQARKEAKEKYNKISATHNQIKKTQPLKFIIREGNNHWIIQKIMSLRLGGGGATTDQPPVWEETTSYDSLYNFKWQPWSNGIKYDQISTYGCKQLVNHIEGHESITTKDQLFINMKSYCEKVSGINVHDLLPLTFILDFKSEFIYDQIEAFRSIYKLIDANLHLDVNEINKKIFQYQVSTERRAAHAIRNPYKLMQSAHDHKNIWLLKPTGLNRGRGIHIFTSLDELRQILIDNYDIYWFPGSGNGQTNNKTNQQQPSVLQSPNKDNIDDPTQTTYNGSMISNEQQTNASAANAQTEKEKQQQMKLRSFSFVVQKYIEKPMLFKNRKFDIRVWVLISFDFKVYLFNECYVRTSCEEYDLGQDNLDKIYVHLTNNAIQKFSDNYGKFEDGNQISLKELCDFMSTTEQSQGLTGNEIKDKMSQQHRELIIHSLKAIKGKLKIRKYTFELVGYDFIIDEDLQSYMIEVNTNPCIEESSQLLKTLVPRMLDDMFRLTIDTVFAVPNSNSNGNSGVPANSTQQSQTNQSSNINNTNIQTQQPNSTNATADSPGTSTQQNSAPASKCSPFPVPGYDDCQNMWEQIFTYQP